MKPRLNGWLVAALCSLIVASGCTGAEAPSPVDGKDKPLGAIPFDVIPREDLPEAVDARLGLALREPGRGHSYVFEEDTYLFYDLGCPKEVRLVQMDNGSAALVAVMTESPDPLAAKMHLPEKDRWWPVLFQDEHGNELANTRIHQVNHTNIRAGETVYMRFYLPDLAAGCLVPEPRMIHTRPAPRIADLIMDENVKSGLLAGAPEIASISADSGTIQVDFRTAPEMIESTPLRERLLFGSLSNTLLEYYDRDREVRFTLNGGKLESPTGTLDLDAPFHLDDTFIRFRDVIDEKPFQDSGQIQTLFDELRLKRPDGAYAEAYSVRLGDAFRKDLLLFIKALSLREEGEIAEIGSLLAYNCWYFDLKQCHEDLKRQVAVTDLGKRELLAANTLLAAMEDSRLGFLH